MAGLGGLLGHDGQCKLCNSLDHGGLVDYSQIFLILLASFIYTATTYGFGMRVVDIVATGGNVTKAMKVSSLVHSPAVK